MKLFVVLCIAALGLANGQIREFTRSSTEKIQPEPNAQFDIKSMKDKVRQLDSPSKGKPEGEDAEGSPKDKEYSTPGWSNEVCNSFVFIEGADEEKDGEKGWISPQMHLDTLLETSSKVSIPDGGDSADSMEKEANRKDTDDAVAEQSKNDPGAIAQHRAHLCEQCKTAVTVAKFIARDTPLPVPVIGELDIASKLRNKQAALYMPSLQKTVLQMCMVARGHFNFHVSRCDRVKKDLCGRIPPNMIRSILKKEKANEKICTTYGFCEEKKVEDVAEETALIEKMSHRIQQKAGQAMAVGK
jgi:hypothetical protein